MPKSLPKEALKLWESVYEAAKKDGDDDEKAAKKAWGALKKAGWNKDESGKWTKKAILSELSLIIKRASFDRETGERCWRAETSDTQEDHYGDNMTLNLFEDFISRIEVEQEAPYSSTSGYWKGGMPYMSISHYPDYNGKGVPGIVRSVYVDGNYLKAKGVFNDTPLGAACWKAINEDLKDNEKEDKIRISIGFLDYAHTHKDSGYVFERKSLSDICPECFMSMFTGENSAKEYTKGQLVHLALTRIPANERTGIYPDMEERSMATRKEDAESIVGEELAEELEAQETAIPEEVQKAMVVKSEDEEVEVEEELAEEEVVEEPAEEANPLDELRAEIDELKSRMVEPEVRTIEDHVLTNAFLEFTERFDAIANSKAPAEEKLRLLQEPYETFGLEIRDAVSEAIQEADDVEPQEYDGLVKALSEVFAPMNQKLDMILAQKDYQNPIQTPQRRSVNPADLMNMPAKKSNKPLSIDEYARRSVGLTS